MKTIQNIAIRNNELLLPSLSSGPMTATSVLSRPDVVTVVANMIELGFTPDQQGLGSLMNMNADDLGTWWAGARDALRDVTFDDRNMSEFVVYKNFPAEVLGMSEARYWVAQIMMYLGFEKEIFAQDEAQRPEMKDRPAPRVLRSKLDEPTYPTGLLLLMKSKTKSWTDPEKSDVVDLVRHVCRNLVGPLTIDVSSFGFRENGVHLASELRQDPKVEIRASDATDALRLAKAIGAPVITPTTSPVRFFVHPEPKTPKRKPRASMKIGTLSRPDRRLIVAMLENSRDLRGDAERRPRDFKALMKRLRPGDFDAPRTQAVYDDLYAGRISGKQAGVENALRRNDADIAFAEAETLPAGLRLRRFRKLYEIAPVSAVNMAIAAFPDLETGRILEFSGQLRAMNEAKHRVIVPKGETRKMQILPNDGARIDAEHVEALNAAIADLVATRLASHFPDGIRRSEDFDRLASVKLPENGQAFAKYGRGTSFPMPEGDGFVRTASYWEHKSSNGMSSWFDNGIIWANEDFSEVGAVCWTNLRKGQEIVFSGDPVNSKEDRGRACQMIDIYPEKLSGVRYGIWNILAYSGIKFSDAGEVLGTLQCGTDPQSGKLYEPSRATFTFKLERPALTSYLAVMDFETRELIYLDMDIGGTTGSAERNDAFVKQRMPAVLESLRYKPSWHDLLSVLPESPEGAPVGYGDAGFSAVRGMSFAKTDPDADYAPIDIELLLVGKGGAYTREHALPANENRMEI